ncbi:Ig-like domain-containing protein [Roseibium salinum]|uniref:Ig-like domain-containing protein n=1 Tax=Roseibium salinum TaxID=1604349 RepID=UPI00361F8BF5
MTADDTFAVDEDAVLSGVSLLANDADADGDTLSIATVNGSAANVGNLIQLASGAILTVNLDGTFDYDQNGAFDALADGETATDSFTYTATDGVEGSGTATVTITVNGTSVNAAPVAANDAFSVDENIVLSGVSLLANDADANGDALSIATVNGSVANVGNQILLASGAILTVNADGTFDYDQNGAFDALADGETAIDSFTYTATDGVEGSGTATVTITVNGASENTVPVAADDSYNVAENETLSNNLLVNDDDGDGDSLTIVEVEGSATDVGNQITLASGARLTVNADGSFDYDPNGAFDYLEAGQTGTDSFSYRISDGQGGYDTATVSLTIDGYSPSVTTEPASVTVDFEGMVPGTYSGQEGLEFAGMNITSDSPLSGSLSGISSGFTITSSDMDFDLDSLMLQAVSGRVRLQFEAYDDGVLVGSTTVNTRSNRVSEVTFDSTFDSADRIVVSANGEFLVDEIGLVTHAEGLPGGNTAPEAADDSFATDEGTPVSRNLLANDGDADGDALTVTSVAGQTGGTVTLATGAIVIFAEDGSFTYDPNGAFDYLFDGESATDSFVYEISDGNGGADTATAVIAISGIGTPPPEPATAVIGFESGTIGEAFTSEDGFVFTDLVATDRSTGVAAGSLAGQSSGDSLTIARSDGEAFDFEQCFFSAVSGKNVEVTVEGYFDGQLVGSDSFRTWDNKESLATLPDSTFDQVDEVVITATGGVILDELTLIF